MYTMDFLSEINNLISYLILSYIVSKEIDLKGGRTI